MQKFKHFNHFRLTGKGLGVGSEQGLESSHSAFKKVWVRYWVKDILSPTYLVNYLDAVTGVNKKPWKFISACMQYTGLIMVLFLKLGNQIWLSLHSNVEYVSVAIQKAFYLPPFCHSLQLVTYLIILPV